MLAFTTKLFLHPLFHFFFWLVLTVWLIVMGISTGGWIRWINFIVAIISLGNVIENIVNSIRYFQNDKEKH